MPPLQSILSLCLLLGLLAGQTANAFDKQLGKITFTLDGIERKYLLYTPSTIDRFPGKRPLVIVSHGGGSTARGMVKLSKGRFNELAVKYGFYVVYPHAIDRTWDFGKGKIAENRLRRVDDLRYIRTILQQLASRLPIDEKRIFATGFSLGGQLSWHLACKLPGQIRAIAPVSMPMQRYLDTDCPPGPPVGLLLMNGTSDPIVPYDGGDIRLFRRTWGKVLSTDASIRKWLERNRCVSESAAVSIIDKVDDGMTVKRTDWRCKNAPVALLRIEKGGHSWPSGSRYLFKHIIGEINRDIDGADEIWNFFEQFN